MPHKGNITIIRPSGGKVRLHLDEIWRYRDLIYILVMRNVKIRYKQTIVGIAGAIISPLFSMIIFTVFFGKLAKLPSDNVPYAIFVFSGLLYWNYFSTALLNVNQSFLADANIIQKVYFPRLVLPLSTSITPLVDFGIALIILCGLMVFYHFSPSFMGFLLLPVFLLIAFLTATGIGLVSASLNVRFRDVTYALSFFLQLLLYLTPIIYPVSIIPKQYQWLLFLNPMAGVVMTSRDSLLHTAPINWLFLFTSLVISLVLFLLGIIYFRRAEKSFADVL
ncbi:MAG: ABC transporter permease [Patescibacteria group bacterium]|nr:ABC transporter permease [Patescibacteria group bacterium]